MLIIVQIVFHTSVFKKFLAKLKKVLQLKGRLKGSCPRKSKKLKKILEKVVFKIIELLTMFQTKR